MSNTGSGVILKRQGTVPVSAILGAIADMEFRHWWNRDLRGRVRIFPSLERRPTVSGVIYGYTLGFSLRWPF